MTEKRRCGTCIYRDIPCRDAVGLCKDYSNWQPIAQCKYGMNNCQFLGDEDTCAICAETVFGLSEFLPNKKPIAQEKPVEKIQMTEDQAMCLYRMAGDGHVEFIKRLRQKGYIRKSAVEEAEEEYIAYKERKNCFVAEIVMDKMYLAIQELESEIARLKK